MRGALWYLGLCLVFLLAAWYEGLDADPGGYTDRPLTLDKAEHLGLAFVLTSLAFLLLHAHPLYAAIVTVIAGIGWELMQARPRRPFASGKRTGFFSVLDVLADTLGALLAYLLLAGL